MVDGRDVSVAPLDLASDVHNAVVTFTDRRTSLRGTAPRNVLIAAFPTDSRLWIDNGASPRRIISMETGPGGTFVIDLPPGDYFVAATTDDLRQVWRERGMLSRLAAGADRVTLREGDEITVNPPMVTVR